MFNEKNEELVNGKKMEVWQSPKYIESKNKAIELISSKKYDLTEGDFWILMNTTKSGKMAYTGLIISHNGCLKINDKIEQKFKPECLKRDLVAGSLIYEYNCPEQGLYEVGEVSEENCKNDYPFAMAFKRCFDRVVLKNCKLAYSGIYSDSEAEEFKEKIEAPTLKCSESLVNEMKSLGGTLEIAAAYFKCKVEELEDKQIQLLIDMKRAQMTEDTRLKAKGEVDV